MVNIPSTPTNRIASTIFEQQTTTSAGVPVRKVIAFNADYDYGKKPIVCKHWIMDSQNKVIASADILGVKTIRRAHGSQRWKTNLCAGAD